MEGPIRSADERLERGDPVGALGLVRAAREAGGTGPWLDLIEARASFTFGRTRDAMRLVSSASTSAVPEVRAGAALLWGRILAAEGDPSAARARLVEALDVPLGLSTIDALRVEADLAELDARLGQGEETDRRLEEVAEALDAAQDPVGAAQVLLRLADRHLAREATDAAFRALLLAEERVASTDEPGLLVPVWERLAEVAIAVREPSRALLLARRAIARVPHDDPWSKARLWSTVGRAHALNGDLEGALMAHRRSAEIAELASAPSAAARLDEASVLLRMGRRAEAAERMAAVPLAAADPEDAVRCALGIVAAGGVLATATFSEQLRRVSRWLEDPRGRSLRLLEALAWAAEVCTERVRESHGGVRAVARAVRLRAMVLSLAVALDRPAEAVRQGRLLQELGGHAAPIPAGPFDLHRKIGWGAVGDVWRGRHHEHRVPVAVKVLSRRHENPRMAQLFVTEVRAMAALDHPNIVRVLGTGTLGPESEAVSHGELRGGNPWFAMELAEGGTLETVCGRLPWSSCRAIVTSLLDALAHAHARGVVHLDLKPPNALLRREEGRTVVLLSDFGLAKLVHADVARGAVVGTPRSMAPEQFRGEARDYGPWTDLYALGALVVELLTGRPLFPVDDTLEAQREAHLHTEWEGLPPSVVVPAGLEEWLRTLLAKDPAERFHRAADAAWALLRLGDVPDTVAPAPPPTERFRPRSYTLSQHTAAGEEPSVPLAGPVGAERPRSPHRPPVAPDWRPLVGRAPVRNFVDVAPTLFGLARVPLVGREVERDWVWGQLQAVARGGGPRVVVVSGPRGIGRKALCRWLCERAHELGTATILDATGGLDGLRGLRGLVERHLRLAGLAAEAAADRVRRALPDLPPDGADDLATLVVEHGLAQAGVDRVAAVATMVQLLAAGRPVILRVERGAARDPDEELLLRLLGQGAAPVLGLVESESGPGQDERGIRLGPLTEETTDALIDSLLPLTPPARRAVRRVCGGHADLVVAVVGGLLARDALVRVSQAWELRPGEVVRLPEPVLAEWTPRVTERMLSAPLPARTALAAAALLGDRLDLVRLEAVAASVGIEPAQLASTFPELLPEDFASRPSLRHPAVRAIVTEMFVDLLAAEAAVAAVEVSPEGCEVLQASLLVRAGRMFEAPPALLDAARRSLDEGDPDDALQLLDRRAEILRGLGKDESGAEQVPDALLRARVAHEKGQADAPTLLAIACALAERHEQHASLGEALLLRAEGLAASGDAGQARLELRRAVDAFAAGGDLVGTARALQGAGDLARRTGDVETALTLLERSLGRLGNDRTGARAAVRASIANAARMLDRLDDAERQLALAEPDLAAAPEGVRSAVLAVAGDLARDRRDPLRAEQLLREALALVPWHDVARVRDLQVRRAMANLGAGRFGEARRVLDGLPLTGLGRLAHLVLAARADEDAWSAAWGAVSDQLESLDRDVAWLLDQAGQRAASDARTSRATAPFRAAVRIYRSRGLTHLAEEVEERVRALERGRS